MEDDIYRGMLIPKGSTVIANIRYLFSPTDYWGLANSCALFVVHRAMNVDESVYADPGAFNPMRFLPRPEGNAEPYPSKNEAFGFGR
ncbi:hypothetical protein C0991_002620, partial [Blastosporella zonata]